MPCSASVPRSLPPAGTVTDFSPLILRVTSPALTSLARAMRITPTNASTVPVNITTPRTIVESIFLSVLPA